VTAQITEISGVWRQNCCEPNRLKLNTVSEEMTTGAANLTIITMHAERHGDNVMYERASKRPAAPVAVMTRRGQSLDR